MRRLRLVRPCPTPDVVRGEHCDTCDKRVHDLTRSSDPAADVARLGGAVCARVLVAAVALTGCSGAFDEVGHDGTTTPTITITITPDAGSDAQAPDEPSYFLGEMSSTD